MRCVMGLIVCIGLAWPAAVYASTDIQDAMMVASFTVGCRSPALPAPKFVALRGSVNFEQAVIGDATQWCRPTSLGEILLQAASADAAYS